LNLSRTLLRLLLGRRLPKTSGTLTVPGLHAPLRIRRDRWGIPYIEAADDEDAAFGLGFCHGQDRAFQLEVLLRVVRGTLAEVIGQRGLPIDRLSRRIGFARASHEQLPVLDPELRSLLDAYGRGVTAGATVGTPRAHEFVLLRCRPTPWTAADSLGMVKLMSFMLCSNWDAELARLRLLRDDGSEALAALDPVHADHLPVTSPPGAQAGRALDLLTEEVNAFLAVVPPGGGSNNWVVGPGRTATGRALLANDPHLSASLPPHWYLAHVRTPAWAVAGASFLGGPSFPAGHNGFAGWGVTAGLIDNTDLFLEAVGPDGASVRGPDGFTPCPVCEEVIHVKGAGPVTERVLITPRGPIISPALSDTPEALALRATWLDPLPLDGLLRVHRARSFEEFRDILSRWPGSSQNLVYADITGKIGWQLMGRAPRRRAGHGLLPRPGWLPDSGWEEDPVPFADIPHAEDPECGFLATANAAPVPAGQGPFLGIDWLEGYRLQAIQRALGSRDDWDIPSTQALQCDQQSLPWEEMREAVLAVPAKDPDARRALELLRPWDGRLSADSPAAAIYELFAAEMLQRLARARAPKSAGPALGKSLSPLNSVGFFSFRRAGQLARLLREHPAEWFARPWDEEVADALACVVRHLHGSRGPDVRRWAWGEVRPLTLGHPLGQSRLLAGAFNLGPFPHGGDTHTINQASVAPLDPLSVPDSIASLRMVLDVGAWENSRFCLPGGQSGNPLSPHHDDQLVLWQRGEGVAIAWTEEEVAREVRETLEVRPAGLS
jgi:penicillin amidase